MIAVSGGGDSMALLHASARWAASHGRPIASVSVDHGLSATSREAARLARDQAAALGIGEALLLTLQPPLAPGPGLQARARHARHLVLAETARALGAPAVLLGHTEDDLAETAMMRARRGGDWRTLAAIGALDHSPLWPEGRGLSVARPLLDLPRMALRAWLADRGLAWRDDPANEDLRFERVRVRAGLTGRDGQTQRAQALAEARAARRAAEREDALVRARLTEAVQYERGGAIALERADLAEPVLRGRLLQVLLAAAGGGAAAPAHHRAEALAATIQAQPEGAATLGGALARWDERTLRLTRDPGALGLRDRQPPPPIPLDPSGRTVWDRRFEVGALPRAAALAPLWTAAPDALNELPGRGAPGDPLALDELGRPLGPALALGRVRCLTRDRALHALRPEPISPQSARPS